MKVALELAAEHLFEWRPSTSLRSGFSEIVGVLAGGVFRGPECATGFAAW